MELETKSSINTPQRFRLKLQEELVARCKRNPSYSLRAFAKQLGVNHAALSQILAGKRPLSQKMFLKMAEGLSLSPREIAQFSSPMALETKPTEQMDHDIFMVLSDWYHFAILELIEVKHFKQDAKWISQALGITIHEAHAAIERLLRVGMIKLNTKKKWQRANEAHLELSNFNQTSPARKKWLKQNFELALKSIDDVPFEKRAISGTTMAIDSKKIKKARELIAEFRRQLQTTLADSDSCDGVYHLSIGLFPLTKSKEN